MGTSIGGQTFNKGDVVAGQKFYAANYSALIDQMQALNDELVDECVSLAGTQTISGVKTFSAKQILSVGATNNGTPSAGTDVPTVTSVATQIAAALPDDDAFGSWLSRSNNTQYTAPSDGFVIAWGTIDAILTGQTPSGTTRMQARAQASIPRGITMPVKKNNTWKVTNASTVWWIPIGA